jgi:hypothetical protein
MTTPDPSQVTSSAQELRDLVDRWYLEVISLPSLEADEALVRAARLEADIMMARTRAMRAQIRAVASVVSREVDPLLATLRSQTTLLQRATYLRRARQT